MKDWGVGLRLGLGLRLGIEGSRKKDGLENEAVGYGLEDRLKNEAVE
jgi:hypothetical protein